MSVTVDESTGVRWPTSVVCFGGEDWWYHNRGHCDMQMMRQFARHGRVLYVNSIVMRKLNITEGVMFWRRLARKARSIARGLVRVSDGFSVYSPVTAPVHHLPGARSLNERLLREQVRLAMRRMGLGNPLIWVNCPAACDTALALPRAALVYQRTDRYEEHPGVDTEQITRYDRTLRRRADLTFYCNRELYEQEAGQCRKAVYVPHGVDYERFAHASRDPRTPPDMRGLDRPVVGFFGAIDSHKFNLPLMDAVAERMSDITFVLVGAPSVDCTALERHSNVVMLGQRDYDEIPHYGKCFDVCVMPFNRNRWVEAINPIKLKEYLALGKPVVTTSFGELAGYDGLVRVADDAAGFASAIRAALGDTASEAMAARRSSVAGHSWYNKAAEVLEALAVMSEEAQWRRSA